MGIIQQTIQFNYKDTREFCSKIGPFTRACFCAGVEMILQKSSQDVQVKFSTANSNYILNLGNDIYQYNILEKSKLTKLINVLVNSNYVLNIKVPVTKQRMTEELGIDCYLLGMTLALRSSVNI